ncbi:MAG: glycosyltransferase [Candidatus Dojkabacteria bacterium]
MKLENNDKIFITGGHLTPALAVLEELQERGYRNLVWVGTQYSQTQSEHKSAEYEQVTARNIRFIPFHAGKVWRRWTIRTAFKALTNLLKIPLGFITAFPLIMGERPKVVISFGGYLALPIVIAARLQQIKVVTHEQTTTIGMANRIIARFAHKVFVSWEETVGKFPETKVVLTGNPVRREVLRVTTSNFSFPDKLPVIYVTGGNQGANTINWRLMKILPELLKDANVLHQTGKSSITQDYHKASELKASLPEELKPRYIIRDNIYGDQIGEAFGKADLVVSRSGANTIAELLLLQIPSILIPIPWSSNNEQLRNARMLKSTGLAYLLEQYDEMPPSELLEAIKIGLKRIKKKQGFNGKPIEEVTQASAKLVIPNGAKNIVDQLEKL